MIRQVYETLKEDSRKGDFCDLVRKDLEEVEIDFSEEDIMTISKMDWKKYVHKKIKDASLKYLVNENKEKNKTKHIIFEKLEMSEYLVRNENTALSKVIFIVRAGTFDGKAWNEWNYRDKLCVMCKLEDENMENFMNCTSYGKRPPEISWINIYENDPDEQSLIAIEIRRRYAIRKLKLNEVGLPQLNLAPLLQ